MRLATAWINGEPRLLLDGPHGLVDVVALAPELAGIHDVGSLLAAGSAALRAIQSLDVDHSGDSALTADDLRWAPPVTNPSKIICIGLNYRAHAAEGGDELPSRPIIFAKFANTLVASGDDVMHPHITESLDYEGELGVVIGSRVANLSVEAAAAAVAGYLVANDVTARDIQSSDPASQWVRGKSLDTFAPMGPYFVTADVVADWRQLRLQTWVNGELRQNELCGDMVFGVEELVSFISQDMTLEPGDIILSGTPSGVGAGFTPPRWLHPGDVVEVEISGLGKLTSKVVAAHAT
jgi:2-keto-4-pentenoate hydratase/2-oxohepta-3-ene-1,7-dioic acid hydratase in catechol pathway